MKRDLGLPPGLEERAVPPEDPTRLRPVDWFTVVYLATTLVPMLFFLTADPVIPVLVPAHAAGMGLIIGARRLGLARYPVGEALLAFYPLPLFALFYSEVGILCRVLHLGLLYDAPIQRIELRLFGGHPSQDLHARIGSFAIGDYLHLGYVSYYLLAPVLLLTLWFRRPRAAFEEAIACIALAFYVSFLIFIAYPVAGPYHAFTPPDPSLLGRVMPSVARWIVDRGSSIGAAFPSSHVAVALTIWIMAMRFHAGLAVLYALLVPALAVGAIYGGFHYATDVAAGAVLGLLVGTVGFQLTTVLSTRRTGR